MKKGIFFVVLASLFMTSCLKDGFNDFDALQHPMYFHGTVNPTLGVPIGTGSANIYDMLKMVQLSVATMEVNNNGTITFVYSDSTAHWHFDMDGNSGANPRRPSTKEVVYTSRKNIEGSVAIDLFENISILDSATIEVKEILVYFNAYVLAHAQPQTQAMLASHNVHFYYDSITLSVIGQDNVKYPILNLQDSIPIDSLLNGQHIVLFNNTDVSDIINRRPNKIEYSARLNIQFEDAFFATAGITEDQYVADSLGITDIDIDAVINVRFPLAAYINGLEYTTDIDFSPSFHLDDLQVDSSMIYIECENELPLSLLVDAKLVDANGIELCSLLDPVQTVVAGADVQFNPTANIYTATTPKTTLIAVPVTASVFESILNTKKIRLHAILNTSETGNVLDKCVSIQADNYLNLRVYAKLRPSYTLDIPLGGNSGNEKGGAQ